MAIHAGITHITSYSYEHPVQLGPQIIRLRPAPHSRTPIISYSLDIKPKNHFQNWQQDPHGNFLARLVFPERTQEFRIAVDLVADLQIINPFDFFLEESAETFPFTYESWLSEELKPYLAHPEPGPKLKAWLAEVDRSEMGTVDFVANLNARLEKDVNYLIRMEPGVQTPEETLEKGSGSCRDSAWLLVQILRNLGLAARFVSGYLIQLTPDVESLDGPNGPEADFTDLHAWAEVYLPGAGWFGLDVTSGLAAGEGHIPLAATPDPLSAAPITGLVEPAETKFHFDMQVSRVRETPRVTKPYTPEAWAQIEDLGHKIDKQLADQDVRLTMGGEPTFVSIDDMEGAEWNTAAVGPMKRGLADELIRKLRDRFAPSGFLHYGQGKWYPGESLPRWAFSIYWRQDGEPIWSRGDLIAREAQDDNPDIDQVGDFAQGVADRLGLTEDFALPAFEDPLTYMVKEQNLPDNVDPLDSKLEDAEERARLVRVFERGLDKPSGFVLPIQVQQSADSKSRWVSERWKLRRKRLFLVPGDSPVGFRLPLGSLPHVEPLDYPYIVPTDPFDEFGDLPREPDAARQPYLQGAQTAGPDSPQAQEVVAQELSSGDDMTVRTAIAFEARDGKLCVFMPPTERLEDYLELLAAMEDTAAELNLPLHIEGYDPPKDPRLNKISVTPDPGVIEVNVHPAENWQQLMDITLGLYEDARQTRLGTEKFMVDGRHTGTGGGNHLVLGGKTPKDSPFIRRPDLLKSLICFWQNHPSLSYLFSGLFIGPTSQAPRLDEARHDALYEMEIALKECPTPDDLKDAPVPPWLVDRIFRNLLIDVSGNTHRSEICIDKLYSPDGPTGRLGLVEFRGFEMPPHAEMSLAQQLLLRALIARFWDKPYETKLVRWGTRLHDQFMLPHYVWEDFKDVLADLSYHGFHFDPVWFQSHLEFRFPLYGHVHYQGVDIELRQALEPWHVMGEEGAVGGTVRFVDSSVERLQVRAQNFNEDRYMILCNSRALPMTNTGAKGDYVAGCRYRAWRPGACLHPTIDVHAPLVFELYDTWSKRAIGGCTYHVSHPGGRAHETFPINSYEAEGRRLARFFNIGHSIGEITPATPEVNPDFPMTLDLRRS